MTFIDVNTDQPNPSTTMPIPSNMIADMKISASTHAHPLDPLTAAVSGDQLTSILSC